MVCNGNSKSGLTHSGEEKSNGFIDETTWQLYLADIIFINKTNLVPKEDLHKLRIINYISK